MKKGVILGSVTYVQVITAVGGCIFFFRPKNIYKDPDDGRQRFLLELEFVQCLANPTYIHCMIFTSLHLYVLMVWTSFNNSSSGLA